MSCGVIKKKTNKQKKHTNKQANKHIRLDLTQENDDSDKACVLDMDVKIDNNHIIHFFFYKNHIFQAQVKR